MLKIGQAKPRLRYPLKIHIIVGRSLTKFSINCFLLFVTTGIFSSTPSFAQVDENAFKPIEILPNTPEVAELTKNAHATNSLHTGAIAQNIPLVNFSAKRLNVPISLNYNSNGIKVDQVASSVGLGWSLNAGGFISRTVLGKPDESVTLIDAPSVPTDIFTWDIFTEKLLSPYADNQPDLFTFSIEGTNGTFIVESNGIRKLDENNFKIIGNAADGFTITTPKGVRYVFSDVEEVKTMNHCEIGGGNRVFIPNSWLLTKIEHPLGEYVLFEYYSKSYTHSSSVSQTVSKLLVPKGGVTQGFPYLSCATTQHNLGKFLARISSNLGESITFEYQEREDVLGALSLKNIIVKENGTPLKTINFKYSYSQVSSNEYYSEYSDVAGKRLFLDSLNFIGQNGGKESYGFNYIDKNSLPPRLSYAKDRFGFFNGKRNICLIPKPDNNDVTAVSLGIPAFGDRTPNGTYAQIGLLNKISFPTGGVDSILFEPHIVTNENAGCSKPPFYMSGESTFKQIARFEETTSISCRQKVTLHFACTAIGEADYDDQYYITSVDVYDSMNNQIFSGSAGKNEVKNVQISLSPGNYTFRLAVKGPSWGNLEIDFSGINAAPFKEVGGLRVKEIQKKDNNEIKEVVSYSYAVNGIESPIVADPMPFYNNNFELISQHGPSVYTEYMSFSFFDFPQYSGVSVGYDNVVEKFGRNAENGSVTHKFTNFTDKTAEVEIIKLYLIPGAPLSYDARKSGQEFYTSFLDGNGNLKKEVWKYYNDKPELKRTKVYYIARNRNGRIIRSGKEPVVIVGVDINKFELSSAWNKLDSVKTIVYLENGQTQKLVEKESYDYGNLSHLLVTTQRKVGSDGRITTMNITYPDDYPVGDLLLNSMSANNLKDYPIELTRYVEENGIKKMIGGDLINYSLDGKGKMNSLMNLELTSPLLAENFKFSNKVVGQLPSVGPNSNFAPSDLYQTKIQYQEYDQWGNPLQGTQEDGVVVSYLWGYNGRYLLAKITNASLDEVKNILGGDAVLAQLNIVNVSDVFINQKVNLLRQGLPKSQISSYTYAPSVGITSQTDQKGQITYYEYDDFQRLKHLKDQHGNIIKSYDYHYKP